MTIVVDADVARSAGQRPGKSICCTEILQAIRVTELRVHFGPKIEEEWFKHMNSYARAWYVYMSQHHRLDLSEPDECGQLLEHLDSLPGHISHRALMLKDRHLVDAALSTDSRIVSGDKKARTAFRGVALSAVPILQSLHWAQADDGEAGKYTIQWLKAGSLDDESLMLITEIS